MEQIIQVLVYIHAFFGGIGLVSGAVSIALKKGSKNHKAAGKVFSYAMIISALISLFVARMPGHENSFLFLIGVFTIYLVLAGNRALTLRKKAEADWIDKLISGAMIVTSVVMIFFGITGITAKTDGAILFLFFGGFGLFISVKDFYAFRTYHENKNVGLLNHIGRMTGAFIASITAFMVAGLNIGTLAVWMAPTILGSIYIVYWSRKVKNERIKNKDLDSVVTTTR